jgi:hypothetical protein
MTDKNRVNIPVGLLVLDFVGVLLIVAGLYETFGGSPLVPAHWRFVGYNWALVVAGVLLTLPLVFNIVKLAGKPKPNAPPQTVVRNR